MSLHIEKIAISCRAKIYGGPCICECINEEGKNTFFSSEQTYELMHCLHELEDKQNYLPGKQKGLLQEHDKELRRKLAIDLSVLLMQENDALAVRNVSKEIKSSILVY